MAWFHLKVKSVLGRNSDLEIEYGYEWDKNPALFLLEIQWME